jgi:hypothetical protein
VSPQWTLSLSFPHQNPIHASELQLEISMVTEMKQYRECVDLFTKLWAAALCEFANLFPRSSKLSVHYIGIYNQHFDIISQSVLVRLCPATLLTYLFTYLLTHLLTYLLTYLLTDLLIYILTYLLIIYLLTYSLTYLLHGAESFLKSWPFYAASQEIPRVLLKPKVHYGIRNCPPPVSILSQANPVHTPTPHFLTIHPNIIIPSTSGSPQWYLSLRSPHKNPVHVSPLPHTRYMPRPSHSSRFYHPRNSGWGVQIMKLLIMKFSPLPLYLVPLRPK